MSEQSSEDPSSGGEGSGSGVGASARSGVTPNKDSKLYEKPSGGKNKLIRLLTVLAYVMSVSMAAIMLSLYYVFLWDPHGMGPRYGRQVAALPSELNYSTGSSAPSFQSRHQLQEASSNATGNSNQTATDSSASVPHTATNHTSFDPLAT